MKHGDLAIVACAAAVAATLLVPFAFGGAAALRDAAQFPLGGITAVGAVVIAGWLAKAAKFRLLTARLGQRTGSVACLAVSLACDFAYAATPAGIGGYPATIFLFGRLGVAPACAATVAAADQVLDLVFFATVIPLASLAMLNSCQPLALDAGLGALVLGSVAGVGSVWLIRRRESARPLTCALLRLGWLRRRRAALLRLWRALNTHLRELRTAPAPFVAAIALATVLQWILRLAALDVILAWLGHPAPASAVLLLQAVALHAGQWTGAPAGIGGADALLAEALRAWAPLATIATALMLWRIATFHLALLAGGSAFALLAARRRRPMSVTVIDAHVS